MRVSARIVLLAAVLSLAPLRVKPDLRIAGFPLVRPAVYEVLAQAAPGTMDADPVQAERTRTSRFHYLMLGYGLIWICLGVFMFDLTRKVGRVKGEIEELKERLSATDARSGR